MATTVRTDAKAGYCQWCRQGDHGVCASTTCKCTQVVHRNRPGFGRAANGGQAAEVRRNGGGSTPSAQPPARGAPTAKKAKAETVWGLVKEEPAPKAKPKPPGPADRARPLLDDIIEAGERDWHRIALFATGPAAGQVRKSLERAYPEGWEWKAGRDGEGRPAVFVRWLGGAEA